MPLTPKDPNFAYRFGRRWTINGHDVAIGRLRSRTLKDARWSEPYLFCECDFRPKDEPVVIGGKNDPFRCPAKAKARDLLMREARERHGRRWKKLGLKKSVLDVHRLVKNGAWLGQRNNGLIYVQEVARVLDAPEPEVWKACGELFAEDRLDLNGAILADHKRRFRLPSPMAGIIYRVVGDPLGYPNGDAGDGAVYDFEARLQKKLGYRHGRTAFGRKNYPAVPPEIVAEHALDLIASLIEKAVADGRDGIQRLRRMRRRDIEDKLGRLAKAHPEIKRDAFAEYVNELKRLAFDRAKLYEAYAANEGKKPPSTAKRKRIMLSTLREMSAEYRGWAETLRRTIEQ